MAALIGFRLKWIDERFFVIVRVALDGGKHELAGVAAPLTLFYWYQRIAYL